MRRPTGHAYQPAVQRSLLEPRIGHHVSPGQARLGQCELLGCAGTDTVQERTLDSGGGRFASAHTSAAGRSLPSSMRHTGAP